MSTRWARSQRRRRRLWLSGRGGGGPMRNGWAEGGRAICLKTSALLTYHIPI